MISKLKQSRIHLNLTVEEVASRLKIRKQYIIAIEENRLEEVPGKAYIDGYIKMYCNYLGIPYSEYSSLEENLENVNIEPIFATNKSKHRVGIAVLLMLILGALSWYYVTNEVQHRSTIMEHLENLDPKNYLSNSDNSNNKEDKHLTEE
jgi:cytoskeletal protein RodZ